MVISTIKKASNITSPISGSSNVEKIEEIDTDKLVQRWKDELSIDISTEFIDTNKLSLYLCKDSYLKFFHPPCAAGSNALYEKLSKFDWYYMSDKWEFRCADRDIKALNRVAEVGCARGDYLVRLAAKGMDVVGFEFNRKAAYDARKKGITVLSEKIDEVETKLIESFDVVCSFQVLEHVTEPKKFINDCLGLLKPGGKLILSVPNGEVFDALYTNVILDMPPHHMTHWYSKTFKRLEEYFPIRLIKIKKEPLATYHIDSYLASLKRKIPSGFLYKIANNKFTEKILRKLLSIGGRKFINGHTLYVCYVKENS